MTNHEKKLEELCGNVSDARFTYENSTTQMGPSRLAALNIAERRLSEYEADEALHDHAEYIEPEIEVLGVKVVETEALEATTALIMPTGTSLEAAFGSKEDVSGFVKLILDDANLEAAKHDVTTKKGRKAIISVAAGVTRKKTKLDKEGLRLTETRREEIANINSGRKGFDSELSAGAAAIRKPVTDWEEIEAEKKAVLQERLLEITIGDFTRDSASIEIYAHLEKIADTPLGEDWGDFREDAAIQKDAVCANLRDLFDDAVEREANEAELEAFRKQKAKEEAAAAEAAEIERQKQAEIDAENKMHADASEENARFDLAVKRQAAAVQQAIDGAEAQRVADLAAAEQTRLDDIAAAEQAERDAAQAKADQLAADRQAAAENLERLEKKAQAKIDRQAAERTKAHNASQFRAKARDQINAVFDSLTRVELIDAIINDEIALLRFVPEAVK